MSTVAKPVVIIGGGGHARVVIDALRTAGRRIAGVIDLKVPERLPPDVPYLGSDMRAVSARDVELALGVGSVEVGEKNRRPEIFGEGTRAGFTWASVRHASAVIAPDVQLGEGVQLMAGCVVQPGTRLGDNVIVNTRASIDHDCLVGEHSHIAPGVVLSGGVVIGAGSHLGTGCIVIQGVTVGTGAFVGAGTVVTGPVGDRCRIVLPRQRP